MSYLENWLINDEENQICLLLGTLKYFAIWSILSSKNLSYEFSFISRSMITMPSFYSSTDNSSFLDFDFF